jgi:hypothetical protein
VVRQGAFRSICTQLLASGGAGSTGSWELGAGRWELLGAGRRGGVDRVNQKIKKPKLKAKTICHLPFAWLLVAAADVVAARRDAVLAQPSEAPRPAPQGPVLHLGTGAAASFQRIFWDLGPGHKPDISLEK